MVTPCLLKLQDSKNTPNFITANAYLFTQIRNIWLVEKTLKHLNHIMWKILLGKVNIQSDFCEWKYNLCLKRKQLGKYTFIWPSACHFCLGNKIGAIFG